MKLFKLSTYSALVIIVSFSVAFRSLILIHFQAQKEAMEQQLFPICYAAALDESLNGSQQEELAATVESFEGVANAGVDRPIPSWTGPKEHEEDWIQLWKTHMPAILYATTEFLPRPREQAPLLADKISRATGVAQLHWDQNRLERFSAAMDQWQKERTFFSILSIFFIAAALGGLLASYPRHLRREYIVRTGVSGAGVHVKPERIWLRLILWHLFASAVLFSLFFSLAFWMHPFPSPDQTNIYFLRSLLEGACLAGALSMAICLLGWWMRTSDADSSAAVHPPLGV
ncbi:MAG: hypothetical protein JXR73_22020 [Candidatus Omnitrophica bacterium]|nr:hypothetical protein [Candidatus Omnitrophota bacterium]